MAAPVPNSWNARCFSSIVPETHLAMASSPGWSAILTGTLPRTAIVQAESASGLRERARKVRPEYTHGDLRRVATARHQPEAEMIQMLLLEEGVPSTLRRSAGFDVPDYLAGYDMHDLVGVERGEVDGVVVWVNDLSVACGGRGRRELPVDERVAYRVGRKIKYDGATGKVLDCSDANDLLRRKYREGWTLNG